MNFISLREVLESINKFVPVDEQLIKMDELDLFIKGDSFYFAWKKEFVLEKINQSIEDVVRYSESSCALDTYMHNMGDAAPRWYDRSQTGRPKLSKKAQEEGLMMLSQMANAFERLKYGFRSGEIRFEKFSFKCLGGQYVSLPKDDLDRLNQIGFQMEEMREFLKNSGIPSGLCVDVGISSQADFYSQGQSSEAKHADVSMDCLKISDEKLVELNDESGCLSADQVKENQNSLGRDDPEGEGVSTKGSLTQEINEQVKGVLQKSNEEVWLQKNQLFMGGGRSKVRRRHPLDSLIRDAQLAVAKLGGDHEDCVEVWWQLVEIARQPKPPKPINRVGKDGTIYYDNGKIDCAQYTYNNLRSRFKVWLRSLAESDNH